MLSRRALTGAALASLSALMGGATVVLVRYIMPQTDPFSLQMARYGIGALLMLGFVLAFLERRRIAHSDWPAIVALSILFYTVFPYCFAKGMAETTAARGAIVFTAAPLITLILGSIAGVERMSIRKVAAVAVAITGIAVTMGEEVETFAPNAWRGDIMMVLAASCNALYVLTARRYVARYGGLRLTAWSMAIGSLVMVPLAFAFGAPLTGALDFDAAGWIVFAILAVPGAAIMVFIYVTAIAMTTPTGVTMTVGFNPLSAIMLGSLILDEPITARILIGFACITVAVILANLEREPSPSANPV